MFLIVLSSTAGVEEAFSVADLSGGVLSADAGVVVDTAGGAAVRLLNAGLAERI